MNKMEKYIDWNGKAEIAKHLTIAELQGAINDCVSCVNKGIDEGYYSDEASIYRKELNKRLGGVK